MQRVTRLANKDMQESGVLKGSAIRLPAYQSACHGQKSMISRAILLIRLTSLSRRCCIRRCEPSNEHVARKRARINLHVPLCLHNTFRKPSHQKLKRHHDRPPAIPYIHIQLQLEKGKNLLSRGY